jgi:hypothetical protein
MATLFRPNVPATTDENAHTYVDGRAGPYPIWALPASKVSPSHLSLACCGSSWIPNSAPLRSLPHEDRDLFIAGSIGHVIAFDNVSRLPDCCCDSIASLGTARSSCGGQTEPRSGLGNRSECSLGAATRNSGAVSTSTGPSRLGVRCGTSDTGTPKMNPAPPRLGEPARARAPPPPGSSVRSGL